MSRFYIYILSSESRTLYIGVTNDLARRLQEHRAGQGYGSAFTRHYKVHRLVYYECFEDIRSAILREKQLKGWRRSKKVAIINAANPDWNDLAPPL